MWCMGQGFRPSTAWQQAVPLPASKAAKNDDCVATEFHDKLFRLQQLINELHRRNVNVIMDGVFYHVRAGRSPEAPR